MVQTKHNYKILQKKEDEKQLQIYAEAALAKGSTNPRELENLSKTKNKSVLFWIAHNKYTPPGVLKKLSEHSSPTILAAVAQNINTPNETIHKLKDEADKDISDRASVTFKKQTKELLKLWLQ